MEWLRQPLNQNPMQSPWGSLEMSRDRALILGAQANGFDLHSLACHECSFFLVSFPPWYLTSNKATIQLLKLLRTSRLVKLSIVWTLVVSFSTSSIKLNDCKFELSTWALVYRRAWVPSMSRNPTWHSQIHYCVKINSHTSHFFVKLAYIAYVPQNDKPFSHLLFIG